MTSALSLLLLTLLVSPTFGQNLGRYGAVFPIIEQDIRQVISAKLHQMEASGELKRHQKMVVEKVEKGVRRPKPLSLTTTNSPKTFEVDPSIIVNRDIVTPNGALIAQAGTRLNPFNQVSFSKTLVFFNADDPKQVRWVNHHYQDYDYVKLILTGGDVKDASERFGMLYFDLEGRLSRYFQLTHVPSVIAQKGLVWQVQEIGQGAL